MTASALVAQLHSLGIALEVSEDRLVVNGPAAVLTDALVDAIRAQKAALLAQLSTNDIVDTGAGPDTPPIAVDVETIGAGSSLPLPWRPIDRLFCVGFATPERRFAFPAADRASIQRWLRTPGPKIFHNSGYDLPWLLASGFDVAGPIHDTMWPLAFANGTAIKGLKAQDGGAGYPVYLPKDSALFPECVLDYCANDAAAALRLYRRGSPWHDHPLYRLYSRLAPRIARISTRGLPLFRDRAEALWVEAAARHAALRRELIAAAPIRWTSHPQVARILRLPRTNDAALAGCAHPAVPTLRAFRKVDVLLSTFLRKFRESGNGHVHGLITLGGSRIGRTSSSHMNLQNIPRDRAVRRLFGAAGFDWLKLDFAQAELVVAAVLSGCRPLLEAFRSGRDPHVETASRIFGIPLDAVTKEQRAIGKLLNFAFLYGGGIDPVLEQAGLAGIAMTPEAAAEFREQWFRAYPEIKAWQDDIRRRLWRGETITSAFGRCWQIDPEAPRSWNQALQAPIASTASDLLLLGLDAVGNRLHGCGEIVNLVHDEIDVLIPVGAWSTLAETVRDIARTMAAIDRRFPMRVEVAVGPDWGSAVEQFTVGAP
jgi:hypothetical protein